MRDAWYVVEAYSITHVIIGVLLIRAFREHTQSAALFLCSLMVTLFLAFLTFKGVRIASRAMAVVIALIPTYLAWPSANAPSEFDIYNVYGLLVAAYFFIGAIKLWRVKELPTRFTEPPSEPHH
jgi:hypothetical protein